MSPTSTAVIPDQPKLPEYPVAALALYPNWTRESYLAKFGIQSPPFDASKPVKLWFATDATRFTVYDSTAQKITPLTLNLDVAAAVNLPGAYVYTKYSPPVNVATYVTELGLTTLTAGFVTDADAAALAAAIGGTVGEELSPRGTPYTYQTTGSKRYVILVHGLRWSADYLMQVWTAAGIGHAGTWDTIANRVPLFTPAPDFTSAQDSTPAPVGFPIRALLPTESPKPEMMSLVIARSDMQQPASPEGGSFSDADRAVLNAVNAKLDRLLAWNHVQ